MAGIQNIFVSALPEASEVYDHHLLPVEIWIEIFFYLTDAERWNLARTSKFFFSIFENWVGFNTTPIFHTDELQSYISTKLVTSNAEPERSNLFTFVEMWTMESSYAPEDILLLSNKKRISWNTRRDLNRGSYAITVFPHDMSKEFLPGESINGNCLAMIPLNFESNNFNNFPLEFMPCTEEFKNLFDSSAVPGTMKNERFLSTHWTVHPDKR